MTAKVIRQECTYVLLDEIQEVGEWEKGGNGLLVAHMLLVLR